MLGPEATAVVETEPIPVVRGALSSAFIVLRSCRGEDMQASVMPFSSAITPTLSRRMMMSRGRFAPLGDTSRR